MKTGFKKVVLVIISILCVALVYAIDPQSEACQPLPDGQGCSQITCSDSNEQCIPTKIRVNYNGQSPIHTILECQCMDLQTDCHININPQFEVYCTGVCPDPNEQCQLIETDNGNGTIDYECSCISIQPEVVLSDIPSITISESNELKCLKSTAPEYNDWVKWGEPNCWCCSRHCRGDADCKKSMGMWVATYDIYLLRSAFNKADTILKNMTYGICADFDHKASMGIRVATPDLNTLKAYFNKAETFVPCCDLDKNCILDANDKWNFWKN